MDHKTTSDIKGDVTGELQNGFSPTQGTFKGDVKGETQNGFSPTQGAFKKDAAGELQNDIQVTFSDKQQLVTDDNKFDSVLLQIGEFGRFQITALCCFSVISFLGAFPLLSQVFYAKATDHWCNDRAWKRAYCAVNTSEAQCSLAQRDATIPVKRNTDGSYLRYEQCKQYDRQFWNSSYDLDDINITSCDEGWNYDSHDTLISDFNLVCDREAFPELAESIYFVGVFVGCIVCGRISDRFGRSKTLFIFMAIHAVDGILIGCVHDFWIYAVLRFVLGLSGWGITSSSYILRTEFVRPSRRATAGPALWFFYSGGFMTLALVAYFIPNWRTLQFITASLFFIPLFFIPFIPESPRWLISQNRYDEAEKILRKVAKINKKELPSNFMEDLRTNELLEKSKPKKTYNIIDTMRFPRLRLRMINLMFNWFVQSFVYYGLSLSTSNLGVDIYIAFCISGAVEIPAYFLCIIAMDTMGRKISTISSMLLGGIACLCTSFIPHGLVRALVAMVGKFGITASFAIIYVYTVEIVPTPLRAIGLGLCSMSSRIGGIVAPFVLLLNKVWDPLPLIIFGSFCIIAGVLIVCIPETKGAALPETPEEAEAFTGKSTPITSTTKHVTLEEDGTLYSL